MNTPNNQPTGEPAAAAAASPTYRKRMTLRQLRRRCRRLAPLVVLLDFLHPYLIRSAYRLKQLRKAWRRNRFRRNTGRERGESSRNGTRHAVGDTGFTHYRITPNA